jgi:hypothetical protein
MNTIEKCNELLIALTKYVQSLEYIDDNDCDWLDEIDVNILDIFYISIYVLKLSPELRPVCLHNINESDSNLNNCQKNKLMNDIKRLYCMLYKMPKLDAYQQYLLQTKLIKLKYEIECLHESIINTKNKKPKH